MGPTTMSMDPETRYPAAAEHHSVATTSSPEISRTAVQTGRVLSILALLFLAMDAAMKVLGVTAAVDGTTALGYSSTVILPLGVVQLLCLVLYAIPRTSVLGAVLDRLSRRRHRHACAHR